MVTNRDFVESVRRSRRYFLRHIAGLTPEQIDFKPFPECKSVRETISHLIVDDRTALESIRTGHEPDYEAAQERETDYAKLLTLLEASHLELTTFLDANYGSKPLETPLSAWGAPMPAAQAIAHLTSEDYYHAGQVAFIRMATDPAWDYYEVIYGSAG